MWMLLHNLIAPYDWTNWMSRFHVRPIYTAKLNISAKHPVKWSSRAGLTLRWNSDGNKHENSLLSRGLLNCEKVLPFCVCASRLLSAFFVPHALRPYTTTAAHTHIHTRNTQLDPISINWNDGMASRQWMRYSVEALNENRQFVIRLELIARLQSAHKRHRFGFQQKCSRIKIELNVYRDAELENPSEAKRS